MLITLLGLACKNPDKESETTYFPETFLWGASIAGFQVEAGCPSIDASECEDDASDWYQWVTDSELVAESSNYLSGEPLSNSPGHYELYNQDFSLATGLGLNAIRTSIEWSRLFPNPEAANATTVDELATYADPVALSYYNAYFDALHASGMTPLVTLNHYTLPLWVHNGKACHENLDTCTERGWMDIDKIGPQIALFAGFCAKTFGDRVDRWGTLNEPLAVVVAGYLLPSADRTNPPGVVNPDAAVKVLFNQALGHIYMYDAVKANDTVDADNDGESSMIGVVDNLVALAPSDPANEMDADGVDAANYVYNLAFLNAAIKGEFDWDLDGVAEDVRPELAGKMDFLGINYYTRITVRGLGVPLFGDFAKFTFFPEVLFEDYPEGMYDVAVLGASYGLPILIAENGKAESDETTGEVWLRPHLEALLRAYQEGVEVEGYFYWSLVDNYEWNHGTSMHFGLHGYDMTTKERTAKPLAQDYTALIQELTSP